MQIKTLVSLSVFSLEVACNRHTKKCHHATVRKYGWRRQTYMQPIEDILGQCSYSGIVQEVVADYSLGI